MGLRCELSGYYDTQTPLMAAAKSQQDASVLATLIELRAEVNAPARTGLVAMSFCRTPKQVKVLLEHRADMPPSSLSGIASFGGPETMKELLSCRCDINQTEDNRYGPLHATTLFSRGNCRAVETAKFLLAQRADVNARTAPPHHGDSAVAEFKHCLESSGYFARCERALS